MGISPYRIKLVPGSKQSARRAVAFLVCSGMSEISAEDAFNRLKGNRLRELQSRFDYWVDGGVKDSYFHGWPNDPAHKHCFVFKWNDKNISHRLYGFLFNPRPRQAPAFQVCILCFHATKTTWETDPRDLDGVTRLRADPQVVTAIKQYFPD